MGKKSSKLIISRSTRLVLLTAILLLFGAFTSKLSNDVKEVLFDPIEEIVRNAIQEKQFPGCQILVMQHGRTVMNRAYGHLMYDSLTSVTTKTIYDVASITKVMATTLMVLDLYDQDLIRLDDPISCYLEEYAGTNKESVTVRQLLAHNGQLKSYIPLWEKTFQSSFCEDVNLGGGFDINSPILQDSLRIWIRDSELGKFRGRSRYRYSDIGFMILHQLAERVSSTSMDEYVVENFYQPLGLKNTLFNPLKQGVPYTQIAPTELDLHYRFEQVWGEVHDRNALLFGGVAGHAGLFSNATDLATLTNSFLSQDDQNSLLENETIQECRTPQFSRNRRGLGWDRKNEKVSEFVSSNSFGHKGFTGTMIWADPEHDLVFVFLSNRVYPDAENWKLISRKTRSRIQDVVYEALVPIHASNKSEVE